MKWNDYLQILVFFALLIFLSPPLGRFMAKVFDGKSTFLHPLLAPLEKTFYRVTAVNPAQEMGWVTYFLAALAFNIVGILSLMALMMTQKWLPLNPQQLDNVPWALALNTAVSFITNTNWQAYAGETTMSYLTQMAGLAVHNFLSAATGIAILIAVIRGLQRHSAKTLGNFWVDMARANLYVLLPVSSILALVLCAQGVVQNFKPYTTAQLVETYPSQVQNVDAQGHTNNATVTVSTQMIPTGPAASQIAIKQLGTNGGGFFGQNSAHPFENPTPLTNFLELLALIIIPAGLVFTYGEMVGDRRQGYCIFGVMLVLFVGAMCLGLYAETQSNPIMRGATTLMEGKEQRLGVAMSVLWSVATTGTSCGAVNSMHDSFMPLAGLAPLWNLMLGCIVFGGVGAGLYGILMHVLIAVFIAGLMIGRTPEYLGKKIGAWDATWAIVAIMAPNVLILAGSALACVSAAGLVGLGNQGPHGLSEILYAYASSAANNGSAFAGLNANTNFYNLTLATAMFFGRFVVALAVLAIAGNLASKKTVPASPGTLPTNNFTFAVVLLGIIVIVGALTFFPALCLGPIAEHGLMLAGRTF